MITLSGFPCNSTFVSFLIKVQQIYHSNVQGHPCLLAGSVLLSLLQRWIDFVDVSLRSLDGHLENLDPQVNAMTRSTLLKV